MRHFPLLTHAFLCLVLLGLLGTTSPSYGDRTTSNPILSPRNLEAPFPYVHGGTRSWPVCERTVPPDATITLSIKPKTPRPKSTPSPPSTPSTPSTASTASTPSTPSTPPTGITATLTRDGFLRVTSTPESPKEAFLIDTSITLAGGTTESQPLRLLPAPPNRPITYYADFGDDLIRIFKNSSDGSWRPVTKSGFDQYFRRLQMQGLTRLITWMNSFTLILDPQNYPPEAWSRYEKQARAIIESPQLRERFERIKKEAAKRHRGSHISWEWMSWLMQHRLSQDIAAILSESAVQHGISLSVSYRPFEAALTKYYEIPAFDTNGEFLWSFVPNATPVVNFKTDQTCFAHYRTVLKAMGHADAGTLEAIEVPGVQNADAFLDRFRKRGDNLRIVSSRFPPLQRDSYVLQRKPDGEFVVRPFREFASAADARLHEVTGYTVEKGEDGSVRISGLKIPDDDQYIILSNPAGANEALDFHVFQPTRLRSKAGTRLGRDNTYWVLDASLDPQSKTRVAGIPPSGKQHSEFNATEEGIKILQKRREERLSLLGYVLVIDRGSRYSVEMMDFNQAAMRKNAVAELRTVLSYPAFDSIFINTRSHTQLAATMGDGEETGLRTKAELWADRERHAHLGIDRAYAPIAVAKDPSLLETAAHPETVEQITTWQPGAWFDTCQSADSPYRWRYARNAEVARGVRKLLEDLEEAFPGTRIQVVLPEAEETVRRVKERVAALPNPAGKPYGPRNNGGIWSSINYIKSIGEGMAMLDLKGLAAEPVFFGIRFAPDFEPFKVLFEESRRALANNRGSTFRGPRSFFYEAQETIRTGVKETIRRRRDAIICYVLSHPQDVNEVILYEAADWSYYVPHSAFDFVDECTK
ncbi:MAG: hypothetical protein ACC645_04410 [Pirellulales bacterium]